MQEPEPDGIVTSASQPSATRPCPVWTREQFHDTCFVRDLTFPWRGGPAAKSGRFKTERKEGKPKTARARTHTHTLILKNRKIPASLEITGEALRITVPLKALLS